ncbi:MAG TPA: flagellar hook-basal body protein [Limnochordales bacterium]
MVRGLFSAASAMLVFARRQDLLANDLANATTPGYRTEVAPVEAFPEMSLYREYRAARSYRGQAGTGAFIGRSYTRWDPAPVRYTGRPLDVAIEGDGFFVVQAPGGPRLTRAGDFVVRPDGLLATPDGHAVLGEGGPIQVGDVPESQLAVTEDGWVTDSEGRALGRLLVVDVPDRTGLVREGANLFRWTAESGDPYPANARLRQGMLEGSATPVAATMVEMIAGVRAYDAAARAVQAEDRMTEALITEMGRTS